MYIGIKHYSCEAYLVMSDKSIVDIVFHCFMYILCVVLCCVLLIALYIVYLLICCLLRHAYLGHIANVCTSICEQLYITTTTTYVYMGLINIHTSNTSSYMYHICNHIRLYTHTHIYAIQLKENTK